MKEAILFIGLPGSGKTTFIRENIKGYVIVSADDLKQKHPDYDPKDPTKVHQWSVKEAEKLMEFTPIKESKFVWILVVLIIPILYV